MKPLSVFPILISFIICSLTATAQHELWGMTYGGGGAWGVIFKTDSSGGNYSVEHLLRANERHTKGTLIQASNGKYYGMSEGGGLNGMGTIFEYDYSTDSVKVLYEFDGTPTGAYPNGDLCQASNGKFYGMTYGGGNDNLGVVFEFDLSGPTLTKIHDFGNYPKGRHPYGSLIEASNGKLYGMTREGGSSGGTGTLFEIDLSGPVLTTLYSFGSGSEGTYPLGKLLEVSNGLLYGVTSQGGSQNAGVIFEFDMSTDTYTKLQDFGVNFGGYHPKGSLMEAMNGKLYGMFKDGSGSSYVGGIYEYDIQEDTLAKRLDFGLGTSTGGYPEFGNLVEGDSNIFYGMTNRQGANDDGVIFRFNNSTGTYTNLYDFDFGPQSYHNVYGSLIESSPGKYLLMTRVGGTAGVGTISEWDTITDTYSIKHSFDSYSLGMRPKGSLMAASDGKFYGLSVEGGAYNIGTIFEYDPFTGEYRKLHDFDGISTGANPNGSLIEAANGKFYGLTRWGGVDWQGTLFEFDPETGILTKLYDFGLNPAPGRPIGSLVEASNGKLYGLSSYGGTNYNRGTLFEYDIATSTLTVKINLTDATGKNPEGSLIETSPGILYGMAIGGGTGFWGTLFEYDISGNVINTKHDFVNTTTGREPTGDLIKASNGKLYGMASNGGANSHGTLFVYDIVNDTLIKLHNFSGTTTGKYPYGSLVESSNGKLYGMTGGGTDASYHGTLFEVDTSAHTVTKVLDFDQSNGSKPHYTQLIKILVNTTWTGAVSTDWHDPANWSHNDVPDMFTTVVIPDVSGASGNFPALSSDAHVKDLLVLPGADIDVQNGVELIVGNEY